MTNAVKLELERIVKSEGGFHAKVAATCLASLSISDKQAWILIERAWLSIDDLLGAVDIDNLKADATFEAIQEKQRFNQSASLR